MRREEGADRGQHPKKEDGWKLDEVEVFLIVVLLVVISKYWAIYLHQSV